METRDADRAGVIVYRDRVFVWTLFGLSVWAEALDDPDTWLGFDYSGQGSAAGDCSGGEEVEFDNYNNADDELTQMGAELADLLEDEAYAANWGAPAVRVWPEVAR